MSTATFRNDSASWRKNMVDEIQQSEPVSDFTAAALRKIERHLFTGDASPEDAYDAGVSVVTKRDAGGVATSSASAPGLVAGMLDQLDIRQGHRVLEIGAGTGYNAALLSELVGRTGHVTTVDLDEDIVAGARANLAAAGVQGVEVVCGDGEYGHAAGAPYDRIIVTAGAWDLPPAWGEQLATDGLLVAPLRIKGVTRSIAFERRGDTWVSRSDFECGFMPIRGAGAMAESNVVLGDALKVRIDDGGTADAVALTEAITTSGVTVWTGVESLDGGIENLDFFMADLDGFCRIIALHGRAASGLAEPVYNWGSRGTIVGGSLAYVTIRRTSSQGPWELGACAYGPAAQELAESLAERIRAWDEAQAGAAKLRFEAHPPGRGDITDSLLVVDKGHIRIIVRTR